MNPVIYLILSLAMISHSFAAADPYEDFRISGNSLEGVEIVAIGDLHGDLNATQKTLRLAGAIDHQNHWIGKNLIVVQTGDIIDRGDYDLEVMGLLGRLEVEALRHQSRLILLNGNHEFMNINSDFRNVSRKSADTFDKISFIDHLTQALPFWKGSLQDLTRYGMSAQGEYFKNHQDTDKPGLSSRAVAFAPKLIFANAFAGRAYFAIVGKTVFVHGGILKQHLEYGLSQIQSDIDSWLDGTHPTMPLSMNHSESPVWTRKYGKLRSDPIAVRSPLETEVCRELNEVLARLEVDKMVIGHTSNPEGKITSACNGKVWRIDVGLSYAMWDHSDEPSSLEILKVGGEIPKILRTPRYYNLPPAQNNRMIDEAESEITFDFENTFTTDIDFVPTSEPY